MGKYKDEHGKSRVGSFLSTIGNVAPDLITLAGDLSGIEALEKLGKAIKGTNSMTSTQKVSALELLKMDLSDEQEKTKRWEADAHSDSWLSKNVRPIIVLYLIFCTSILIVADSIKNGFTVKEHWVTLLTSLLIVAVGGYFSLREFGKFASKKYK